MTNKLVERWPTGEREGNTKKPRFVFCLVAGNISLIKGDTKDKESHQKTRKREKTVFLLSLLWESN